MFYILYAVQISDSQDMCYHSVVVFQFSYSVLEAQKVLNFDQIQFIYFWFFLVACALGII